MFFKSKKMILVFGGLLICFVMLGCSNSADSDSNIRINPSPTFPSVSSISTQTPIATLVPTRKSTRAPQSAESSVPTEALLQEELINDGEGGNDLIQLASSTKTATPSPLLQAPTAPPLPEIGADARQFPWLNFTNQINEEQTLNSAALPKIGTPVPETRFYLSPNNLDQLTELAVWGKGVIQNAIYSPDGKLIYATTDLGLYVYDAETAEQINFRPITSKIEAIAFLPTNNLIALSLDTVPPTIDLLNPQSLTTTDQLSVDAENAPIRLQVSTDGSLLLATFAEETDWVQAWKTEISQSVFSQPLPRSKEDGLETIQMSFAADTKELFFLYGMTTETWGFANDTYQHQSTNPFVTDHTLGGLSEKREEVTFSTFEVSPNGEHLAAGAYWDDDIVIVNAQTGDLEFEFQVRDKSLSQATFNYPEKTAGLSTISTLTGPGVHTTNQIRFTIDSTKVSVASNSLVIELWDIQNQSRTIFLENVGNQLILSPDGRYFAGIKDHLTQWEISGGAYRNVLKQHIGQITDVQFVPNSGNLAISAADGFVYLRNIRNGDLVASLRGYNENSGHFFNPIVTDIDVTADGKLLISSGGEAFKLWNLEDFSTIDLYPPPIYGIIHDNEVSISGNGEFIAVKNYDNIIFILATNPTLETIPATNCGWGNNFSLEEPMLISCGGMCGHHIQTSIDFSPTDEFLLACNHYENKESILKLWEGTEHLKQPLTNVGTKRLEFSSDGSLLTALTTEVYDRSSVNEHLQRLHIWEKIDSNYISKTQIPISNNRPYRYDSIEIAIAGDNSWVATAFSEQGLLFFDAQTGEFVHHLPHIYSPTSIAVSPDGRLIAVGTAAGTVHLWGVP